MDCITRCSLAKAVELNYIGYQYHVFGAIARERKEQTDNPLYFISETGFYSFSSVLYVDVPLYALKQTVLDMLNRFSMARVPVTWHVVGILKYADLIAELLRYGFIRVTTLTGMVYRLISSQDVKHKTEMEFESVKTITELQIFIKILSTCFSVLPEQESALYTAFSQQFTPSNPRLFHYVGKYKGENVATLSLFVDGDVVGLYNVGVIQGFRNLGLGTDVVRFAIQKTYELNKDIIVLVSTESATDLYSRLDFTPYTEIEIYVLDPKSSEKPIDR